MPPADLSLFYPGLKSSPSLNESIVVVQWLRGAIAVISLIQNMGGAAVAYQLASSSHLGDVDGKLLMLTTAMTITSALIGLYGVARKSRLALHWYFISQAWGLSTLVAQWLRDEQRKARLDIFCATHATSSECTSALDPGIMLVAAALMYLSMFLSETLTEALQDLLEDLDTEKVVRFIWDMTQKTSTQVHRFEDSIHKRFEELVKVSMPCLAPPTRRAFVG